MSLDSFPRELRAALAAAQKKLASSVTLLDLRELGAFTSYFLICSGSSAPQVQAISDEIELQLEQGGRRLGHREGYNSAHWILLDYGNFVVHVFHEQARRFFEIERLWRAARRIDVPDDSPPSHSAEAGPRPGRWTVLEEQDT